ncbi:hypothetical protein E5351_02415 [Lactobacillus intestinalis]|uniref:Uncharacterized protein n=1 Tax=Lactobacillus intestinalis TaxID=151781 RepID=A0A4S2BP41_9LACO|nr:hypothetical protein E5351_02415 [Lactobacillus intestinalis]
MSSLSGVEGVGLSSSGSGVGFLSGVGSGSGVGVGSGIGSGSGLSSPPGVVSFTKYTLKIFF